MKALNKIDQMINLLSEYLSEKELEIFTYYMKFPMDETLHHFNISNDELVDIINNAYNLCHNSPFNITHETHSDDNTIIINEIRTLTGQPEEKDFINILLQTYIENLKEDVGTDVTKYVTKTRQTNKFNDSKEECIKHIGRILLEINKNPLHYTDNKNLNKYCHFISECIEQIYELLDAIYGD